MKGMYRRKAGRAVQAADDDPDDEDEDDHELVENLEDDTLDAVLGRPAASVPSVKSGKRTAASGAAQTTANAKRKPARAKKGPAKRGRTGLGPPVQGLEDD